MKQPGSIPSSATDLMDDLGHVAFPFFATVFPLCKMGRGVFNSTDLLL